jgi:hypothetical protein
MESDLLFMLLLAFVLFVGAIVWKVRNDGRAELKGLTKQRDRHRSA